MLKGISLLFAFALTCGVVCAQNSNSSTTTTERPRTNTNRTKPVTTETQEVAAPKPAPKKPATTGQDTAGSDGVLAAFNALLDGIRHASVKEVTGVYWNNPRLSLFNYNGSVTKGWEQVRKNRESSYPEIKDVKLDVSDVSVTMLGPSGAVVTCQWKQSQNYKGVPETAAGRMTLVFKRIGTAWKAIHLHSSPESPNPASIPPSEQQRPSPSPSPTP
ncbi:MAG TPA: nuclear transport factor 2 family protein [Pyrinomonadaceae bacterium]|nr:nuclear transport factor 2 family protein [Pyrinomonadaceae bacterium]